MPARLRRAAYQGLANRLRDAILSGRHPPGSRLPTEMELCRRFDVSRITVRQSLRILAEEGLIERRQGSGTYVSRNPARRVPLLNADFSGSVRRHAPELRRRVLKQRLVPVPPEHAATLGLDAADVVLSARRVDSLAGQPVAFDDLLIPEAYASRLDARLLREVLFVEAWTRAQRFSVGHVTQSVEAVQADRVAARLLRVARRSPLLREATVFFSANATPVGLFVTHYRSDLFRFTTTVAWSSWAGQRVRTKWSD